MNVTVAGHRRLRTRFRPATPHWWLVADATLILADISHRQGVLSHLSFLVTEESGFGEIFQYGKTAVGVLLLTILSARRASLSALIWALVLLLVLLDDSLELHERGGVYLAGALGLESIGALRGNHLGELIAFAGLAVCCMIAVGVGWRYGDREDRRLTRTLLMWFGALAFCAVVLDAVSSFTRRSRFGGGVAALENGGEMIVMSLLVISVWARLRRDAVGATIGPAGPQMRDVP
ncbi:MAG: hypothetical protein M3R55_14400 [Acidobacteriota bacterium]|nr:hypothetical protein [Acidobacteriota bacterium]